MPGARFDARTQQIRKLPIESQPLPKSQYRSVLQASCNIAIDAFHRKSSASTELHRHGNNLPPKALETLYAARETKNRGCGGHMMPCHWADQLIAEAIGRGWRPDGGTVDTSGPASSEDYRLADLFKWPLHFGPKALPLLRWRNSIGSALHAATAKPRDSGGAPQRRECAHRVQRRAAAVAALVRGAPAARRRHRTRDDAGARRRHFRRRALGRRPKARLRLSAMLLRVGDREASRVVSARRQNRRSSATRARWRTGERGAPTTARRTCNVWPISSRPRGTPSSATPRRRRIATSCLLAESSCLIPGGGGFSALAAELAREAVVEGDPQCRSTSN